MSSNANYIPIKILDVVTFPKYIPKDLFLHLIFAIVEGSKKENLRRKMERH